MSEPNKQMEYLVGVSVGTPRDFTPKAWYDEMDRQARAERSWRIRFRIWYFLAYLGFFIGMLIILKSL